MLGETENQFPLARGALSTPGHPKGKFLSVPGSEPQVHGGVFATTHWSLNYYLADQHDRATAMKQGAGQITVSFDAQAAAERYRLEPADSDSPDRLIERRWALALLEQVLTRLEEEFQQAGKCSLFQGLQRFLVAGRGEAKYPEAATHERAAVQSRGDRTWAGNKSSLPGEAVQPPKLEKTRL